MTAQIVGQLLYDEVGHGTPYPMGEARCLRKAMILNENHAEADSEVTDSGVSYIQFNFQEIVMSSYSYQETKPGYFEFVIKQEPFPKPHNKIIIVLAIVGYFGLLLGNGISYAILPNFLIGWLPGLPLILGIIMTCALLFYTYKWVSGKLYPKVEKLNADKIVLITPEMLTEPNGSVIQRDRIDRIVVRNAFDDTIGSVGSPTIVAGGSGITGGVVVGAAMVTGMVNTIAANNRKNAIKKSYILDLEHGGVKVTLAERLTEESAYGLMNTLGRVLNLK